MNPPWIEHPDIAQGMGWRMGVGATYIDGFCEWFGNRSKIEQESYMNDYPEPAEWSGFYRNIIDNFVRK